MTKHKKDIVRTRRLITAISILGIVLTIVVAIFAWRRGLFSSPQAMQEYIKGAGVFGPILFVLLQIVQCVIPIIPGGITSLVGVYLFGPWMGFGLNFIGIYLGEVCGFLLARGLGQNFVQAMVSEDTWNKYSQWLDENEKKIDKLFIWTMVIPGMPDDIICMIVGLTKMPLRFFMLHLAWTRVPALLLYTLFLERAFQAGGAVLQWLRNLIFH